MSSEIKVIPKEIDSLSLKLMKYFFDNMEEAFVYKILLKYQVDDITDFFKFFKNNSEKYFNKKDYVFALIKENLKDFEWINIDGFLKFRMQDYKILVRRISDEIFEEYKVNKRYEKITSLMKVVLKNSEPIIYHLHIDVSKDNFIELYDDYFNDITNICAKEFYKEYGTFEYSQYDFLLCSILNLTPQIITFHNSGKLKNQNFLKTLDKLYGKNIILV